MTAGRWAGVFIVAAVVAPAAEFSRAHDLGAIDMRSIAPTLAKAMGPPFSSAEMPAQEILYATQ